MNKQISETSSAYAIKRVDNKIIIKLRSGYWLSYLKEIGWVFKLLPVLILLFFTLETLDSCKFDADHLKNNLFFASIVTPIGLFVMTAMYVAWGTFSSSGWQLGISRIKTESGASTPVVNFGAASIQSPRFIAMTGKQIPEPDSNSEATPAHWMELQLMPAEENQSPSLIIRTVHRGDSWIAYQEGEELCALLSQELGLERKTLLS